MGAKKSGKIEGFEGEGVGQLLRRLRGVRLTKDGYRAQCPIHRKNDLKIRPLADGTTLVDCRQGCNANQIVRAVGLELNELFPNKCGCK